VATIIAEERHHVLREAILGLDPKDRAVLVLRGLEGHPVEEVATVVRSTPGAVAVRYHRALKKLRGIVPPDLLDELADD
jgi:RNA polymerase sigma factor (sigma-70 family)